MQRSPLCAGITIDSGDPPYCGGHLSRVAVDSGLIEIPAASAGMTEVPIMPQVVAGT